MVPFCLIWTFESLLESDSNPILPTLWEAFAILPPISMRSTSNCFNIPVPNKISPLFSSIAAEKEPDFGTPFLRKSCRRAWLACSFEPVEGAGLLAVCQMISGIMAQIPLPEESRITKKFKHDKKSNTTHNRVISLNSFVNSNPGSNLHGLWWILSLLQQQIHIIVEHIPQLQLFIYYPKK